MDNINLPPKYAKLGNTEMRRLGNSLEYYRDAGCWGMKVKWVDGKWLTEGLPGMDWLFNLDVVEITEEEYKNNNRGYL